MKQRYVLNRGKPPYPPRDLAALYLYGMLHRLRSSRRLEDACPARLDVIWLMQGQTPDHSTLADFVGRHGAAWPRNNRGLIDRSAFVYHETKDEYRCPAGQRLVFLRVSQDKKKWGTAERRQ